MRIGGIGSVYPTYVYNPGVVSSRSMNKLSRISDDVLDKKVDYSGVESKEENQNPLKKGQTIDFEGMLAKQMQQGRNRASKVMPDGMVPVENKEENRAENTEATPSQMQRAIQAYETFMIA